MNKEMNTVSQILEKFAAAGEITFAERNILNIYYKRKFKKIFAHIKHMLNEKL